MHRMIVVTIGYYDFKFNDIDEAMRFADTAVNSISEEEKVKVTVKVTYEN